MAWTDVRRPCALVAAIGMAAAPAWASVRALADLSLEELSAIEVTSVSKRAEALSDAAASIYVITADDIRRSGANSLPDVLRLAPTLQVAALNNDRHAITARGFNGAEANKLLVMIDGRSVYTPLFAGVFWDVQDVLLQDVDRIEVISGPGGTLWGLNAVNGVINVITKAAQDTPGTLLSVGAGSTGADAWARHGRQFGKDDRQGAWRIHAHHSYRQRSELENGRAARDAMRMSHAGFRADWRRAGDAFSVHGKIQQGEQEQADPGTFYIIGVPLELLPIQTRGANLLGRWSRKTTSGGEISAQAYLDRTERVVPITFDQKLTVADIQTQYALAPRRNHAWVFGAAYRMAHDEVANSNFMSFVPQKATQEWVSLFAQDDITLPKRVRLTIGARVESNDYTGVEWLPNARLSWKAAPEHLLWTAASRTVRAPSRIDRDTFIPWPTSVLGPGPTYLLAGGPEVKAEIAKVLEFGWRGRPWSSTSLSLTAFRALYDHLHTQEAGGDRGFLIFAGRMSGAVTGLEGWGSWQPTPNWRLSAGFTALYQRFRLRADSTDTQASLPQAEGRDPAQTWQVRSAWDLPGRQEIDVMLRHVSMLPRGHVPSYLTADVRWGWRARPGLDVSVAARNLLGRGHAEYLDASTRTFLRPSLQVQATLEF